MADRPILFSAPMIKALLAGTKTQTRRILKPQPHLLSDTALSYIGLDGKGHKVRIAPGDRLWVKEAHHRTNDSPINHLVGFDAAHNPAHREPYNRQIDGVGRVEFWRHSLGGWGGRSSKNFPSLHMPKWASRITLLVDDVKVERLQDISEDDAIAEGVVKAKIPFEYDEGDIDQDWYAIPGFEDPGTGISAVDMYSTLWEHINGAGSWAANPFVVAYTFRVVLENIDYIGKAAA